MWLRYHTVISATRGKSGIALKEHYVEIHTQYFDIYNINKVLQSQRYLFPVKEIKKLFSEENKVLEHCLKLEDGRVRHI